MTDNEIIKALECCSAHPMKCAKCPYKGASCCTNAHRKDALDLINRQKAEIERLTTIAELGNMRANDYRVMRDKAKNARAEAIKEFADKVIGLIYEADDINAVSEWQILNLVKEITEDKTW